MSDIDIANMLDKAMATDHLWIARNPIETSLLVDELACALAVALESRPLTADREAVETVVGRVLWNAANFPERAQPGMLGANIMPLTNLVTDAVMAVLRPLADVQAEGWECGLVDGKSITMRRMSDEPNAPEPENPYRTPASPEEGND